MKTTATICPEVERFQSQGRDPIARRLRQHAFKELFIDVLGWDEAAASRRFAVGGREFVFDVVAHKRGFQILHCPVGHTVLFNRRLLRDAQRTVAKTIHENIIIYSSEAPPKQVWQWAVRLSDRGRLRHREHPFFSDSPPSGLVRRLKRLLFTLDEEEDITLLHALERVREALDTKPDLELFVRRPRFAERSQQLAEQMMIGGQDAYHRFVLFHRRLANWFACRFHRSHGMDLEDAEQAAMLGLLRAAETFDPSRGCQFSTYASHWLRQTCKRAVAPMTLPIRVPEYAFWPCTKVHRRLLRLASHGPDRVAGYLSEARRHNRIVAKRWNAYRRAVTVRSLSNPANREFYKVRNIPDPMEHPRDRLIHEEDLTRLRVAMQKLKPEDARLVRLRYGLGGRPWTLEAIGRSIGRTRERVRQRVREVEARLHALLTLPDALP